MKTTSYELSKQLYEIAKSKGVQLPVSEWILRENGDPRFPHSLMKATCDDDDYHSYTTDELLNWLPEYCMIYKSYTGYVAYFLPFGKPLFVDKRSVNALCELAIYLIENDLIK